MLWQCRRWLSKQRAPFHGRPIALRGAGLDDRSTASGERHAALSVWPGGGRGTPILPPY